MTHGAAGSRGDAQSSKQGMKRPEGVLTTPDIASGKLVVRQLLVGVAKRPWALAPCRRIRLHGKGHSEDSNSNVRHNTFRVALSVPNRPMADNQAAHKRPLSLTTRDLLRVTEETFSKRKQGL